MGKHERERVREIEEAAVSILNGEEYYLGNNDLKYAVALSEKIRKDFPNYHQAQHVGNKYDSLGDIKLSIDNKTILIEVKILKHGYGTRANISQDAITKYDLIKSRSKGEKILSWSNFRKQKDQNNHVNSKLDEYNNYAEEINKIDSQTKKSKYKKASYLKKIIGATTNTESKAKEIIDNDSSSKDQTKAANIILEIVKSDRKIKIAYLKYLNKHKQDHDNIKKFLFLILTGCHTTKEINQRWKNGLSDILSKLKGEYYIYNTYKREEVLIEQVNHTEKLEKLIDKKISIYFKDNQTNLIIGLNHKKPIIRVVFHWKNKFQGIQTPCLNIFDENYLTIKRD